VQEEPRKIHVARRDGDIQSAQDQPQPFGMLSPDLGLAARGEEALEPSVLKSLRNRRIGTSKV
jgi:hypothetical protein